jgi:hypothetical protein
MELQDWCNSKGIMLTQVPLPQGKDLLTMKSPIRQQIRNRMMAQSKDSKIRPRMVCVCPVT